MTELVTSTTGDRPLDLEAQILAARRAGPEIESAVRAAGQGQAARTSALIHSRSGALAGSVRGVVTRKPYGFVLRVGPGRGAMNVRSGGARRSESKYDLFYDRFVEEGTGERGPRRRMIPKQQRGLVPVAGGRRRPSGRGQAPQRPFSRARRQYDSQVARSLDEQVQNLLDEQIQRAGTTGATP